MKNKIKPLGDRVIIQPLEEKNITESGIMIPDTAKENPQRGKVLAVGPGSRDEDGDLLPIDLIENDIVIFKKYAGNKLKIDGEEIMILSSDEILAKIKPNKKSLK